jgi:hypothetical protein
MAEGLFAIGLVAIGFIAVGLLAIALMVILFVRSVGMRFALPIGRLGMMRMERLGFARGIGRPLGPFNVNVLISEGLIFEVIDDRHCLIFREFEERESGPKEHIGEIIIFESRDVLNDKVF